jgi:hypothetical protein
MKAGSALSERLAKYSGCAKNRAEETHRVGAVMSRWSEVPRKTELPLVLVPAG